MKYFVLTVMFASLFSALNGMQMPEEKMEQVCITTTDNQKIFVPESLLALSPVLKKQTSHNLQSLCSADHLNRLLQLMKAQQGTPYNVHEKLATETLGLMSWLGTCYADNKTAQISALCSILRQACAWQLTPLEQFLRFRLTNTYNICTPEEYALLPKDDLKACGIVPLDCENVIFLFDRNVIDLCPYLQAYLQRAPGMKEGQTDVLRLTQCLSEHLLIIKTCLETLYYHQSLCRPQLPLMAFGYCDPCVASEVLEEKIEQYVLQHIRSLPTISFELIQSADILGLQHLAQSFVNEISLPDGELTVPENLCWYFYNRLPWTKDTLELKLNALVHALQHKTFSSKQINEMIDEMLKVLTFDESVLTILEQPEQAVLCQALKNGLIRQNVGINKRFRLFGCWGGDLSRYSDKLMHSAQPQIIREPGAAQYTVVIGPNKKPQVINQSTQECIRVLDCLSPIHTMEYLNDSCFIAWGDAGVYRCNWQTGEVIQLIDGPCTSATIRTWDSAYVIMKIGITIRIFFFPEYVSLRHLFALLKN